MKCETVGEVYFYHYGFISKRRGGDTMLSQWETMMEKNSYGHCSLRLTVLT